MTGSRVFQTVVLVLGATLLACVVAITVLASLDRTVPGILENLAVGSLTGLAGLLARQPWGENDPQPVTVVDEPVAVEVTPPRRRRTPAE